MDDPSGMLKTSVFSFSQPMRAEKRLSATTVLNTREWRSIPREYAAHENVNSNCVEDRKRPYLPHEDGKGDFRW
jgi:hypothetical protein